jgi:hypothetical protein
MDSSIRQTPDLHSLEIAADSVVSPTIASPTSTVESSVSTLEVTRGLLIHNIDATGIAINASNIILDMRGLSEINKLLNETGSGPGKDINILVLKNCGLDDRVAEGMSYIFANPKIKGFDLSFNNLGTLFQAKMLETLKVFPSFLF